MFRPLISPFLKNNPGTLKYASPSFVLPIYMEDRLTIALPMSATQKNNISNTIRSVSKRLLRFIKQRVRSTEDAEDILQDVFYQFAGNTEPIEQASAWLYKVARNKITDSYRKKKLPLVDDLMLPGEHEEDGFDWKDILLPDHNNPETAYLRNLFWEELQHALDELPAAQRDVFIQNEMEGIPFVSIAEKTGESVATLISRKRYAVLHLRERLRVLRDELINF